VVVSKNAGGAKRVTSLADALRVDFALIHKDRSRSGPQGLNRPYSGMPTQNLDGTVRSLITRVSNVENDDSSDVVADETCEDSMSMSISSLNEMSAAVSVVADTDGEESTITLVGDVQDKVVFLTDDIIDGCQSFLDAANHMVKKCGAEKVYIIATHGVLSGDSVNQISACDSVYKLVVTNTFPITEEKRTNCPKLTVIDISNTLAEAIRRTHNGESVSYLFHNAD